MKSTSLLPSFCPPPAPSRHSNLTDADTCSSSVPLLSNKHFTSLYAFFNNAYKHMSFRKHSYCGIYLFLSDQFTVLTQRVFCCYLFPSNTEN